MAKPAKSILDPTFKYTDAANTDIRKRFDRIRAEQKQSEPVRDQVVAMVRRNRKQP